MLRFSHIIANIAFTIFLIVHAVFIGISNVYIVLVLSFALHIISVVYISSSESRNFFINLLLVLGRNAVVLGLSLYILDANLSLLRHEVFRTCFFLISFIFIISSFFPFIDRNYYIGIRIPILMKSELMWKEAHGFSEVVAYFLTLGIFALYAIMPLSNNIFYQASFVCYVVLFSGITFGYVYLVLWPKSKEGK
jgi:hypothetical protein